jgi:hypothetical protein
MDRAESVLAQSEDADAALQRPQDTEVNWKQRHLGRGFMLVNAHGDVIMAAPAQTRRMAWKFARMQFGTHACLVFKRRGYRATEVNISCDERRVPQW